MIVVEVAGVGPCCRWKLECLMLELGVFMMEHFIRHQRHLSRCCGDRCISGCGIKEAVLTSVTSYRSREVVLGGRAGLASTTLRRRQDTYTRTSQCDAPYMGQIHLLLVLESSSPGSACTPKNVESHFNATLHDTSFRPGVEPSPLCDIPSCRMDEAARWVIDAEQHDAAVL